MQLGVIYSSELAVVQINYLLLMINILIIDDDSVIRSLLQSFLSMKKYKVESVSNGIDALTAISVTKFDIVITDLKLKKFRGADLIKKMQVIQPRVKLIAMSGDTSFDTLPEEIRTSIALIRKPFRLEDVESIIQNLSVVQN
ncbi:MAG: response regulator [Nitrospirae bacterium]|nr:response regulator [Nitrospirota bacterium]